MGCGIRVELIVVSSVAFPAELGRLCMPLDVGGLGMSGLRPWCAVLVVNAVLLDETETGMGADLAFGGVERTSAVGCCWCC